MILYIDGTGRDKIVFGLGDGKKAWKKTQKFNPHKSHEMLGFLGQFLKERSVKPERLKKIMVNSGPGSYTGVRVSLSIAQALGFAWDVPVKAAAGSGFKISK